MKQFECVTPNITIRKYNARHPNQRILTKSVLTQERNNSRRNPTCNLIRKGTIVGNVGLQATNPVMDLYGYCEAYRHIWGYGIVKHCKSLENQR